MNLFREVRRTVNRRAYDQSMDIGVNELRELWSHAIQALPPDLDRYKKLAKEMVKGWKSGDAEIIERIRHQHPRLRTMTDAELRNTRFTLADAQFLVARAVGFDSWPKLKKSVESPVSEFELAVEAVISGDLETLSRLLRENPELI